MPLLPSSFNGSWKANARLRLPYFASLYTKTTHTAHLEIHLTASKDEISYNANKKGLRTFEVRRPYK
jgi:hypothetical protein